MNSFAQSVHKLLGIQLTTDQLEAFRIYEEELLAWNQRFNLTAIRDPEMIRVKHFLDSLSCLLIMGTTPMEKVIDVGTGAGFPGVPLKIVCPLIHLTLVESVGKKSDFCEFIVQRLDLNEVTVINERIENLGHSPKHREKYNWALARAVADLTVLVEYLLPLISLGGTMLAMKGENATIETQAAEKALGILGGQLRQLVPVILPGVAEDRFLVCVDKVAVTPSAYPRRAGVPSRKPL